MTEHWSFQAAYRFLGVVRSNARSILTAGTILVTGATGNVGCKVVEQLVAARVPVRAAVQSKAKAKGIIPAGTGLAKSDFNRPETLRAAFRGVDKLFLLTPFVSNMVELGVRAVKEMKASGSANKRLDLLQKTVRGEVPHPPIATLIGFKLTAIKPGQAVIELEASKRHSNPMGTLHGGVLCDIADAAMGLAYASTLEADETFTTIELKGNFLRPVWNAKLRAVGKIVKKGRTIGLVECDVTDEKQNLVARFMSTCMTLRHERSRGR